MLSPLMKAAVSCWNVWRIEPFGRWWLAKGTSMQSYLLVLLHRVVLSAIYSYICCGVVKLVKAQFSECPRALVAGSACFLHRRQGKQSMCFVSGVFICGVHLSKHLKMRVTCELVVAVFMSWHVPTYIGGVPYFLYIVFPGILQQLSKPKEVLVRTYVCGMEMICRHYSLLCVSIPGNDCPQLGLLYSHFTVLVAYWGL